MLLASRTAILRLLVSTGLVTTLAACGQQPTPLVTVVSGATSVHDEALCYAHERGERVNLEECLGPAARERGVRTIEAEAGGVLGVGVDPEIADIGWEVLVDGRQVFPQPVREDTYRRIFLLGDFGLRGPSVLQVRAVTRGGGVRGVWAFRLDPR